MTQTDISQDHLRNSTELANETSAAEARVLIVMTGGTICMKRSSNGFVPARGFLESGLAPRPSFNDGSDSIHILVSVDDHTSILLPSLRTPSSTYRKHVRYVVLEFDELLDSSSINADGWTEIAQTIYRNYTFFDAFVVLHGTDSMLIDAAEFREVCDTDVFSRYGLLVFCTEFYATEFREASDTNGISSPNARTAERRNR